MTCNKVGFETLKEAQQYKKEIYYEGRAGKRCSQYKSLLKMNTYKCHICGKYHFTSMPKKKSRLINKKRNKK